MRECADVKICKCENVQMCEPVLVPSPKALATGDR